MLAKFKVGQQVTYHRSQQFTIMLYEGTVVLCKMLPSGSFFYDIKLNDGKSYFFEVAEGTLYATPNQE